LTQPLAKDVSRHREHETIENFIQTEQAIMGKVIDLENRRKGPSNGLTTPEPWRFRKGLWRTRHFIQMRLSLAEPLVYKPEGLATLPPHFALKGGMSFTIRSLYVNRRDEKKMREIYYLIGLTDCMINQDYPSRLEQIGFSMEVIPSQRVKEQANVSVNFALNPRENLYIAHKKL